MLERVSETETVPQRTPHSGMPWIEVCPHAPYFQTDDGRAWHPIGHNESLTWITLKPLFRRRDLSAVDASIAALAARGVTVLRLMLEYAQVKQGYLETRAGRFSKPVVQMWDDFFALCGRHGLRLLLTPCDTFWMWLRWRDHPYNAAHGGPLDHPSRLLTCPQTRHAIKNRLSFAIRRWGGSGVLFAWDLWNEIHPSQAGESADVFHDFIADLSHHVRQLETSLYGRSHPQTVSLFGPELEWRSHMPLRDPIFRHPDLDFANVHVYQHGTIDDPRNTVDAARDMAAHVRAHLQEIADGRPYFDSEHGPIHRYKDKRKSLPEDFDDEYFRHMQWAHLAAGGAGGGMRWPNRTPHRLTQGMHAAQHALARFMPLVDWLRFRRQPMSPRVLGAHGLHAFGCADKDQAIVYLLRRNAVARSGLIDRRASPCIAGLALGGFPAGRFRVTPFDTCAGEALPAFEVAGAAGELRFLTPPVAADLALAIRRLDRRTLATSAPLHRFNSIPN